MQKLLAPSINVQLSGDWYSGDTTLVDARWNDIATKHGVDVAKHLEEKNYLKKLQEVFAEARLVLARSRDVERTAQLAAALVVIAWVFALSLPCVPFLVLREEWGNEAGLAAGAAETVVAGGVDRLAEGHVVGVDQPQLEKAEIAHRPRRRRS